MAASVGLPRRTQTSRVGGSSVTLHSEEQVIPCGRPSSPKAVTHGDARGEGSHERPDVDRLPLPGHRRVIHHLKKGNATPEKATRYFGWQFYRQILTRAAVPAAAGRPAGPRCHRADGRRLRP
jgi:hypothetical protein